MACKCRFSCDDVPRIQFVFVVFNLFTSSVSLCHGISLPLEFSTKTAYAWSHPSPDINAIVEDSLYTLGGVQGKTCTAVHVSLVSRHGSRYPGLDDPEDLVTIHNKLVAAMKPNSGQEIYSWTNKYPKGSKYDKTLTSTGVTEQEHLGERTGEKLKSLFDGVSMSDLAFFSSEKARTVNSAAAFFRGLNKTVQNNGKDLAGYTSTVREELIKFYDTCQRYIRDVDDNEKAVQQHTDFMNGPQMLRVKHKITQLLSVSNETLTAENVNFMYTMCAFGMEIFNTTTWCSVFDKDDIEVLQYLEDLEYYYRSGPGHKINGLIACPLVSKIFDGMDDVISKTSSSDSRSHGSSKGFLTGQFGFGHTDTLNLLFTALGLFNDSLPLRADNFDMQGQRHYRSNEILPFSSNIMFVLYRCLPPNPSGNVSSRDYYVTVLVNEQPVVLPGCQEDHCRYDDVRQRYGALIGCNFKKVCHVTDSSTRVSPCLLSPAILAITFVLYGWK